MSCASGILGSSITQYRHEKKREAEQNIYGEKIIPGLWVRKCTEIPKEKQSKNIYKANRIEYEFYKHGKLVRRTFGYKDRKCKGKAEENSFLLLCQFELEENVLNRCRYANIKSTSLVPEEYRNRKIVFWKESVGPINIVEVIGSEQLFLHYRIQRKVEK
ncbi:MAG: hypothetical protein ACJAT2_002748 [Bacteriovoracaceae bacterium]|jgi:hypothetical protein